MLIAMNTSNPSTKTSELLSALTDGELGAQAVTMALQDCDQNEAALATWNSYHLIGEALRLPVQHAPVANMDFLMRLNKRLAAEKIMITVDEPVTFDQAVKVKKPSFFNFIHPRSDASNENHVRWKMVAGFASMVAILAIGWNAFGLIAPESASQLAQAKTAPEPSVVTTPLTLAMRDASLDDLLSAHKQLSSPTVLQMSSGVLLNAAYEISQDIRH